MKRCPRCGHSNDDDSGFCIVDGVVLEGGERVFVSLEDETPTRVVPHPQSVETTPLPGIRPAFVYAITSTLAAAVLILAAYIVLTRGPQPTNSRSSNDLPITPTATPTPAPTPSPDSKANREKLRNLVNTNSQTQSERQDGASETARRVEPDKKTKPTPPSRRFNGRVIMWNAVLRLAPSMDAPAVAILPYDHPVTIGKPGGGGSPWYRVSTPNGITGWMHGNTIEFVR